MFNSKVINCVCSKLFKMIKHQDHHPHFGAALKLSVVKKN